eukprot:COSAG01_NODE_965_length_12401_cov_3.496098_6_plen_327_part_00
MPPPVRPRYAGVVTHLSAALRTGDTEGADVVVAWAALESADGAAGPPLNPELVPFGFHGSLLQGAWARDHVRWMQQKDRLGQDIFLVGMHGPLRRWLAFVFCEKAGREMEYLPLTQDTTESDLKQRREILPGGSSAYFDQSAVNAALHGRILIVEGLEKVERNVMPVLNNLLENREIALEDGRFLLPRDRYDSLTPAQREASRLVPVHPGFRVIALGVPVPPFPGNPLDPPLRSRFQARRVDPAPRRALLSALRNEWAPSLAPARSQALVRFASSILGLGLQAGDNGVGVESARVAFHEIMCACRTNGTVEWHTAAMAFSKGSGPC